MCYGSHSLKGHFQCDDTLLYPTAPRQFGKARLPHPQGQIIASGQFRVCAEMECSSACKLE